MPAFVALFMSVNVNLFLCGSAYMCLFLYELPFGHGLPVCLCLMLYMVLMIMYGHQTRHVDDDMGD